MYQISKRLTMAGTFLSLACGFLLTQQPTKAATTSQAATPTTQVVKANSNVLDQGVDGTCNWDVIKEGDEVVLTIHAGQLDPGSIFDKLKYHIDIENTKLIIDPGVIAPKDSSGLFSDLQNIVGLPNLDTSQVTDMENMFDACWVKELDLSNWDTSKVTNMRFMFADCTNLEKVNVKSFNTKNVTTMECMFFGCNKLRKIDLSSFETPKLEDADEMFGGDPHSIYYVDMRNFGNPKNSQIGDIFTRGYICKLTLGPNLVDQNFPNPAARQVFDDNGIKKIVTGFNWIALNGPDKGVKKNYDEVRYVKRDQPVTYVVENSPLINPYNEYKTVTRTINLHLPYPYDEIISFTQKATIHRQVTVNDNETKTYGEWSKDYWDEYNSPFIDWGGPRPAKVAKQIVDGNTQDQTVDIYY